MGQVRTLVSHVCVTWETSVRRAPAVDLFNPLFTVSAISPPPPPRPTPPPPPHMKIYTVTRRALYRAI